VISEAFANQGKQSQINTRSSVKNSPKNNLEFGSKSSLGIAPNIYFIKTLQFKKHNVPEKKRDLIHVQAKHSAKKKRFQQKGNFIFSGQTLRRKKVQVPKKILVPKENNSYFFGPNIVPKKYECQKKI